ncbi:MAG: bifunctional nuclease family protein [Acidimicrobiaceae bacterium]|nr:bifunctional nuclease family protein [Acidimicrobiaceae bacterium]
MPSDTNASKAVDEGIDTELEPPDTGDESIIPGQVEARTEIGTERLPESEDVDQEPVALFNEALLNVPFREVELDSASKVERLRPAEVQDVGVALPETYARMRLRLTDDYSQQVDIPISLEQASALSAVVRGISPPRPFSNTLTCEILKAYGLVIEFVAIVGRSGGTYLAEVTLNSPSAGLKSFPARPSDAVLLALTQSPRAPILVDRLLIP